MGASGGPAIVTDSSLKLLLDPKDDVCNGGKSVMTDLSGNLNSGSLYSGVGVKFVGADDHYINITGSAVSNHEIIYSSQIASTIAAFLGIKYQNKRTVSPLIKTMFND